MHQIQVNTTQNAHYITLIVEKQRQLQYILLQYEQPLEYCDNFLKSLQNNKSIITLAQYKTKVSAIDQEIELIIRGNSECQIITKVLAQRQEIINRLKANLIKRKASNSQLLASSSAKLKNIKKCNLLIIERLRGLKEKWKIEQSEYLMKILQKVNQGIKFLPYTQLKKWIHFSKSNDPLFLIPLRKMQQKTFDQEDDSVYKFLNISGSQRSRLEEADEFMRRMYRQTPVIEEIEKQQNNTNFVSKFGLPAININKNMRQKWQSNKKKAQYSLHDILINYASKEKKHMHLCNNKQLKYKRSNTQAMEHEEPRVFRQNCKLRTSVRNDLSIDLQHQNRYDSVKQVKQVNIGQNQLKQQNLNRKSRLHQNHQPTLEMKSYVDLAQKNRKYLLVGGKEVNLLRKGKHKKLVYKISSNYYKQAELGQHEGQEFQFKKSDQEIPRPTDISLDTHTLQYQPIMDFVFQPLNIQRYMSHQKPQETGTSKKGNSNREKQQKQQVYPYNKSKTEVSPVVESISILLKKSKRQAANQTILSKNNVSISYDEDGPIKDNKYYSRVTIIKSKEDYLYNQSGIFPHRQVIAIQNQASVNYSSPFQKITDLRKEYTQNKADQSPRKYSKNQTQPIFSKINSRQQSLYQPTLQVPGQNQSRRQYPQLELDPVQDQYLPQQNQLINQPTQLDHEQKPQVDNNSNVLAFDTLNVEIANDKKAVEDFLSGLNQKHSYIPTQYKYRSPVQDKPQNISNLALQDNQISILQTENDSTSLIENVSPLNFQLTNKQKAYHQENFPSMSNSLPAITPKLHNQIGKDNKKHARFRQEHIPMVQSLPKLATNTTSQKQYIIGNGLKRNVFWQNSMNFKEIDSNQMNTIKQLPNQTENHHHPSPQSIIKEQEIIPHNYRNQYIHRPNRVQYSKPPLEEVNHKQLSKQEMNILQKCVFQSKSMQSSELLAQLMRVSANQYQHIQSYISSKYFKNRHLIITYCLFNSEIISYCITSPYMMPEHRIILLLHVQVTKSEFDNLLATLTNTFINYIFSRDPAEKIMYLKHKYLFNQKQKADLEMLKTYSGQTKSVLKSKILAENSFVFQRKGAKCNKKEDYTSIFNTRTIFINPIENLSIKSPVHESLYFSSSYLKEVEQRYKKKNAKTFANLKALNKHLEKQQYPTFSNSQIQSKMVSAIHVLEDCLLHTRFFVHSKHFHFTVQPPFTYLHEHENVFYLLIATSNNKSFFLLSDKIFEEDEDVDLYLDFQNHVEGKSLNELFLNQQHNNRIISCPQFKKTMQFQCVQNTNGIVVFELNWKEYIKGVRYLKEQNIYLQLIGPFFCAYVEIDEQNKIHHRYSTMIQQQNIVR